MVGPHSLCATPLPREIWRATSQSVAQRSGVIYTRMLPLPEVKEKFAGDGSEFGRNTPEELSAFIKAEIKKTGQGDQGVRRARRVSARRQEVSIRRLA